MLSGRFGRAALCLALVLTLPLAASADITSLGGSLPERPGNWNATSFDPVNQVYLVTLAGSPITAKFVDATGAPVGPVFGITTASEGYTGWSSTAFGSTSDPAFLVTYTDNYAGKACTHIRYGRIVRYNGGSPTVSPRIYITANGCQWNFSERAQSVWTGSAWVVGVQVDGATYGMATATAEVHTVDMFGNVSAGVNLGDPSDYFGAPSIACKTDGSVCMAIGFAAGYALGPGGGIGNAVYTRLFNGQTLAAITGVVYIDNHLSNEQNHNVIYNPNTDQFLAVWWRAGYVDTRTVSPTGSLGTLKENVFTCAVCGVSGAYAGDVKATFNPKTGTTLVVTKQSPADLYVFEIDDNATQLGGPLLVSTWDGKWPEYDPSLAADPVNGRWLALAVENSGRALLVQGKGVAAPSAKKKVTSDLDGDKKADLFIWRGSTGTFSGMGSKSSYTASAFSDTQFGNTTFSDVPLNGDLDGDGLPDLIIWRPGSGTWYWLLSSASYSYSSGRSVQWGNQSMGDQPLLADIDGDGKDDLIVWRSSTGTFYWLTSSSGYSYANAGSLQWGNSGFGDKPLMGDFDGDGKADFAVWRASNGTFYWILSSKSYSYAAAGSMQWGNDGLSDQPFVADFDGDGKSDLAVWRPGNGTWYWLTSSTGYSYGAANSVQWGNNSMGDKPIVADFDGDGKADVAVWRSTSGIFYWLKSSSGFSYSTGGSATFGVSALGDIVLVR